MSRVQRPLTVRIVRERARVRVVLEGELDVASAGMVRATLLVEQAVWPSVTVDLGGLTFMDCTGLRVLVDAHRLASESGREFAVTRGSPAVERLLELTDLGHAVPRAQ